MSIVGIHIAYRTPPCLNLKFGTFPQRVRVQADRVWHPRRRAWFPPPRYCHRHGSRRPRGLVILGRPTLGALLESGSALQGRYGEVTLKHPSLMVETSDFFRPRSKAAVLEGYLGRYTRAMIQGGRLWPRDDKPIGGVQRCRNRPPRCVVRVVKRSKREA